MAKEYLRILFISMEYPPETGGGGIGSYVSIVAPALVALGHEVHVLSCVREQEPRDYQDRCVWIHRRGQIRLRGVGCLLRSPEAAIRLETALSGWIEMRKLGLPFDVVEYPDWMAEGLVLGLTESLPLVAHLHTPLHLIRAYGGSPDAWAARLGDFLERSAVRRADVVTAPSRLIASGLERSGWVGTAVVEVIPHPVDLERWQGLPGPAQAGPAVLAVGRLEPRKAPEILVQAAAILAPEVPALEIIFVGRGSGTRDGLPYKEWLQRLATGLGVRAEFAGQVLRNELRAWYARARAVAISSRYESFSMTGLEAMACGRPVVCTTRTGLAEIVGQGGGCVVPPDDPHALAAALRPYLMGPASAEAEGIRARGVVEAVCHPAVVAERREAAYLAAIERHECRKAARARWFRNAAPRLAGAAPVWHRVVAREAARTPWKHFYLKTAEQLVELLARHPMVRSSGTLRGLEVLDLGCTPHVSTALAALGARVTQLDVAPEELDKARELAKRVGVAARVRMVLGDAFRPPFPPGSFDVVWNSGFIEHFDDPVRIVRIMAGLVRSGGAVCVLTPAPLTPHSLLVRARVRRRGAYYWDYMGRERSYSCRRLEAMLVQAGLKPLGRSMGNLRRSLLDDAAVLPYLDRAVIRNALYPLMNLLDALELLVPPARGMGFMAGAIGLKA